MNELARELNGILAGTCADRLFSAFGKRIYFPKGIVSQSAEATKNAHRYNATIGMAYEHGQPMILESVAALFNGMGPKETVAYAPTGGDAALREAWRAEIGRKNAGIDTSKLSLPMVVAGLTNGMSLIGDLFIDPADTVLLPDMFWDNYPLIFEGRNRAEIVTFPFYTPGGGFDVEGFKTAARANARNSKLTVILNFPNNPTGYSPSVSEADAVAAAVRELAEGGISLLVVCDDAYFGLFFEQTTYKSSLFSRLYDLHENVLAVKIDGPTKEDFVWGFRLGFITFGSKGLDRAGLDALGMKLMGSIRASVSNSSRPAQSILLKAMKDGSYQRDKDAKFETLMRRYRKVREILDTRKTGFSLSPLPFNSGYFMSFDFKGGSAEALRVKLLSEKGIGTISIQDRYLRIAYASIDEENLEDLYSEIFAAADAIAG